MAIPEIAVVLTALGGFLAGVGGLFIGYRGQSKTDEGNKLALLLEGYDEIVSNLREENKRHLDEFNEARTELANCEARCKECREALLTIERATKAMDEGYRKLVGD